MSHMCIVGFFCSPLSKCSVCHSVLLPARHPADDCPDTSAAISLHLLVAGPVGHATAGAKCVWFWHRRAAYPSPAWGLARGPGGTAGGTCRYGTVCMYVCMYIRDVSINALIVMRLIIFLLASLLSLPSTAVTSSSHSACVDNVPRWCC